jgi:hypothetical protein
MTHLSKIWLNLRKPERSTWKTTKKINWGRYLWNSKHDGADLTLLGYALSLQLALTSLIMVSNYEKTDMYAEFDALVAQWRDDHTTEPTYENKLLRLFMDVPCSIT